jgi:hypothetical protein
MFRNGYGMLQQVFAFLLSGSAFAAGDACPKAFVGISDRSFPAPKEYRRILFSVGYLGIQDQPGVAYTTEILPGLEANVVRLDNGEAWLLQKRLDISKGIRTAEGAADLPANFREPVQIPRERVYLNDAEFRIKLCKAYSHVKGRKDYPELKRLWARGSIYEDRYQGMKLQEKISACVGFPLVGIYVAGNFLFAPVSRVTGYLIGGNDLASHGSNFGYAVPLVAAFNACFKGILPNHPRTAAVLAGTAYVGVNAWEEVNFLGEHQVGQRRVGPGESTFDTVRTDWGDFASGSLGAATMTGLILALDSETYAGFRLAAFCR